MRKREERRECTTLPSREGGGGAVICPISLALSLPCASTPPAARLSPPSLPFPPSPWCHYQPALSLSHAYCRSVSLHHVS